MAKEGLKKFTLGDLDKVDLRPASYEYINDQVQTQLMAGKLNGQQRPEVLQFINDHARKFINSMKYGYDKVEEKGLKSFADTVAPFMDMKGDVLFQAWMDSIPKGKFKKNKR